MESTRSDTEPDSTALPMEVQHRSIDEAAAMLGLAEIDTEFDCMPLDQAKTIMATAGYREFREKFEPRLGVTLFPPLEYKWMHKDPLFVARINVILKDKGVFHARAEDSQYLKATACFVLLANSDRSEWGSDKTDLRQQVEFRGTDAMVKDNHWSITLYKRRTVATTIDLKTVQNSIRVCTGEAVVTRFRAKEGVFELVQDITTKETKINVYDACMPIDHDLVAADPHPPDCMCALVERLVGHGACDDNTPPP